jgi:hypothetical protein
MPHIKRKRTSQGKVCKAPHRKNGQFAKWRPGIQKSRGVCRKKPKKRVCKKTVQKHLKAKRKVSKPAKKTYTRSACRTAAQKTIAVIRKKKYASVTAVKRDVTRMLGKNSKFAMKGKGGAVKKTKKKRTATKRIPYGKIIQSGLTPQQLRAKMMGIPTGSIIQSGMTPQQLRLNASRGVPDAIPMGIPSEIGGPMTADEMIADLAQGEGTITRSPGLVEYGDSIGVDRSTEKISEMGSPPTALGDWLEQFTSAKKPSSVQKRYLRNMSRASPMRLRGKVYDRA